MSATPSALSQALQSNWSLSSPAKTDIDWAVTRVDAATFLNQTKNYAVCCYNPSAPKNVEVLSREVYRNTEHVIVDVFIKVSAGTAAAASVRDSVVTELYRIVHSQEFKIGTLKDVYVERESVKAEAADLVRGALQIACVDFHVVS